MGAVKRLPDPTKDIVATWLAQLSREELHNTTWVDINRRFHGVVMAARAYANENFGDQPEKKAAFFDGLTVGLGALVHDADLAQIRALFEAPAFGETG